LVVHTLLLAGSVQHGLSLGEPGCSLWNAFLDAHKQARFEYALEVPMQYFARTVEIALIENAEHDDYGFTFSPEVWKSAVAACNFVMAQEELRMVMIDD
jgi:hypothetical protein